MTIETQLAEAQDALHKLMTGQAVVSIQRDGKTVQFQQSNRADLQAYISTLQTQLGSSSRRRRPARLVL